MTIEVSQIDHVSVLITDVERSRHFYGEILGLKDKEVAPPKSFDFVVVWYIFGNQHIHLLLKPTPDTESPRHFALQVKDINAAREWFREKNIEIEETVKIPSADRFFVRDPDQNRIEIIQWERPYDPVLDGKCTNTLQSKRIH